MRSVPVRSCAASDIALDLIDLGHDANDPPIEKFAVRRERAARRLPDEKRHA